MVAQSKGISGILIKKNISYLSLVSSLRGEGNKDKEYKSENILVLLNFRLQLPTWAK